MGAGIINMKKTTLCVVFFMLIIPAPTQSINKIDDRMAWNT
jgi:hypothetical protein